MAEFFNYYEPLQAFMDKVKKDVVLKANNSYNLRYSREILNPLFNLLDYQITLINQIVLFIQSMEQINDGNNKNNVQQKNVSHLIDINKDILISMIIKFLTKINSLINQSYNNNNSKYNNKYKYKFNIKSDSVPLFNYGKYGKENALYSNNSKKNINNSSIYPYDERFFNINYIMKKNKEKNKSNYSSKKLIRSSSMKSNLSNLKYNINSNKSFKNRNKHNDFNFNFFGPISKNKDIAIKNKRARDDLDYKNLMAEIKDRAKNESKSTDKIRQKTIPNRSYSNSTKDIFIDLNDDALKTLFNKPIYYNNTLTLNTRASKED